MTLIDTNVLLDLATDDPVWADWSVRHLDAAAVKGPLVINDVVYAELSVGFERIEELDDLLENEAGVTLEEMPREALFLAGKAFRRYRAAGGARLGVLPGFFHRRPCRRSWSAAADTRCQTLPHLFPVCRYGDAGSAVRLFGKATKNLSGMVAGSVAAVPFSSEFQICLCDVTDPGRAPGFSGIHTSSSRLTRRAPAVGFRSPGRRE